jgi:hypothetical protein
MSSADTTTADRDTHVAFLTALMGLVNAAITADTNAQEERKNASMAKKTASKEASLAYMAKTNNSTSAHMLEENARRAQMRAAQLEDAAKTAQNAYYVAKNAAIAAIKKLFGDLSPKQIEECCPLWNPQFIQFFVHFLSKEKEDEPYDSVWRYTKGALDHIFYGFTPDLKKYQVEEYIKRLEWQIMDDDESCPILLKTLAILRELRRRST